MENKKTNEKKTIEPLFNRLVIMETNDITSHGYNKINFPKGKKFDVSGLPIVSTKALQYLRLVFEKKAHQLLP